MKRPDLMHWGIYSRAEGTAEVQGLYRGHYADYVVLLDDLRAACSARGNKPVNDYESVPRAEKRCRKHVKHEAPNEYEALRRCADVLRALVRRDNAEERIALWLDAEKALAALAEAEKGGGA